MSCSAALLQLRCARLRWAAITLLSVAVGNGCSSQSTNPSESGGSGNGGSGGSGAVSSAACASNTIGQAYSSSMVGCDGSEWQCDAETLCGSGWHLCTYTEYVASGGDSIPANHARWLKSCVRQLGDPFVLCPNDQICANCSSSGGPSANVQFSCEGAPTAQNDISPLALTSSTAPQPSKSGCPDSKCAYTDVVVATDNAHDIGAMCCKNP